MKNPILILPDGSFSYSTLVRTERFGIMGLRIDKCEKGTGRVFPGLHLFPLIFFLLHAGCGGDKISEEAFFDRYDACERIISLCGLSRDDLSPCVSWVERNYAETVDRILILECMEKTADCDNMIAECNLEGLKDVLTGVSAETQ